MKFEKKSEKKQTKKTFVYDFNSKSVKNRFFSHLKTVLQKTNIPRRLPFGFQVVWASRINLGSNLSIWVQTVFNGIGGEE